MARGRIANAHAGANGYPKKERKKERTNFTLKKLCFFGKKENLLKSELASQTLKKKRKKIRFGQEK